MDVDEVNFRKQLQKDFLFEAGELLEEIEQNLIGLERSENPGDLINSLFRYIHTIKGSAHISGFKKLGEFVHKLENLLGSLRDEKLSLNNDICDLLFVGSDLTKQMVESHTREQENTVETGELEEKIKLLLSDIDQAESGQEEVQKNFGFFDSDSNTPASEENKPPPSYKAPTNVGADSSKELISKLSTSTILICDDDEATRSYMCEYLDDENFKTLSATNGAEALELIKANSIDLVISDLKMPVMDGVTLLKNIRTFDSKIPVILISGYSEKFSLTQIINLNVEGLAEKPFDMDELLPKINVCLRLKKTKDAVVHLTATNYQVYIKLTKLLIEAKIDKQEHNLKHDLESKLDQAAELMNYALSI